MKKTDVFVLDKHKEPERATSESAGYDVFANEKIAIKPGESVRVTMPVKEVFDKHKIFFFGVVRSSIGIKKGCALIKDPEMVDTRLGLSEWVSTGNESDAWLYNMSNGNITVDKGNRFAQLILRGFDEPQSDINLKDVKKTIIENEKYEILNAEYRKKNDGSVITILKSPITLGPKEEIKFQTGKKAIVDEGCWAKVQLGEKIDERIVMSNQVAVIDRDYANNEMNEGNCFLALRNLSQDIVQIDQEEIICHWSSKRYETLESEKKIAGKRVGGIGSTG